MIRIGLVTVSALKLRSDTKQELPAHIGFCSNIPQELLSLARLKDADIANKPVGQYIYASGALDVSDCESMNGALGLELELKQETFKGFEFHQHLGTSFKVHIIKRDNKKMAKYPCSSLLQNAKGYFKIMLNNTSRSCCDLLNNTVVTPKCETLTDEEKDSQAKHGPYLQLLHDAWVANKDLRSDTEQVHIRAVNAGIHWLLQVRITLKKNAGFLSMEAGFNVDQFSDYFSSPFFSSEPVLAPEPGKMGYTNNVDGTWHQFGDSSYLEKAHLVGQGYDMASMDESMINLGTSNWMLTETGNLDKFIDHYSEEDMRTELKNVSFKPLLYTKSCISWLKNALADFFHVRLYKDKENSQCRKDCTLKERFSNLLEECDANAPCLPDPVCMDDEVQLYSMGYRWHQKKFFKKFKLPTPCDPVEALSNFDDCKCKRHVPYVKEFDPKKAYLPSFLVCHEKQLYRATHYKKEDTEFDPQRWKVVQHIHCL